MRPLRSILSQWRSLRYPMLGVLGLSALVVFCGVGLMAASGALISWAALRPPILDMILLIVAVRFFGIARAAFRYAQRLVSHVVTLKILEKTRVVFYRKIAPLVPSRRHQAGSGDMLSRFANDVDRLQDLFLRVLLPFSVGILVLSVSVVLLWSVSVILSMAVAGLFLAQLVIVPVLLRMSNKDTAAEILAAHGRWHQYLADLILGNADILQFGARGSYRSVGLGMLKERETLRKRLVRSKHLEQFAYTLISQCSLVVSLVILAPLVVSGELNGILLAAVILGILTAFEAFQGSGEILEYLVESGEAASRLSEVCPSRSWDERVAVRPVSGPALDPARRYSVRFDQVSFAYGQKNVLEDLSFEIQPGECLYVRGPSGVGKSTIAHLLLKWYEPDQGKIYLGQQDISILAGEDVRACLSVVSQHTRLFNTTLEQNLLIAKKDATDKELSSALAMVKLDAWVERLPGGIKSEVGETGMRLSGGERQRLAIARALLKNAPLWILDEPDASLDGWTARELRALLDEHLNGRTVLYITHRRPSGPTLELDFPRTKDRA